MRNKTSSQRRFPRLRRAMVRRRDFNDMGLDISLSLDEIIEQLVYPYLPPNPEDQGDKR